MRAEVEIPDVVLESLADRVFERLKPLLVAGQAPGEKDSIFNVSVLAGYLGVTEQWVYDRVTLKEIPHFKAGRYVRFKRSSIDRWIEAQSGPVVSPLSRKLKILKGGNAAD